MLVALGNFWLRGRILTHSAAFRLFVLAAVVVFAENTSQEESAEACQAFSVVGLGSQRHTPKAAAGRAFIQTRGEYYQRGAASSHATLQTRRRPGRSRRSTASLRWQAGQLSSHRAVLLHTTATLQKSHRISALELDELIEHFLDEQASSEDKCYSSLLEAKHHINLLHTHILETSVKINTTEYMIHVINSDLADKMSAIEIASKWERHELRKCTARRQEHVTMWKLLVEELREMKLIAHPAMTADLESWTHGENSHVGAGSLLQVSAPSPSTPRRSKIEQAPGMVQATVQKTRSAAEQFKQCIAHSGPQQHLHELHDATVALKQMGTTPRELLQLRRKTGKPCFANASVEVTVENSTKLLSPLRELESGTYSSVPCGTVDAKYSGAVWLVCSNGTLNATGQCFVNATAKECEAQRKNLQVTFVKAYVELARLVSEFEMSANSTACEGTVSEEAATRRRPLENEADGLTERLEVLVSGLEALNPRLNTSRASEELLRWHVQNLTQECLEMPSTTETLTKVRETIHTLSDCPGLSHVDLLTVPHYTGSWLLTGDLDSTAMQDSHLDELMDTLCREAEGGDVRGRAAETAEIEQHAVEGMPLRNTASLPLLGTCPGCEGDADLLGMDTPSHASGHARICWQSGQALSTATQRRNCTSGPKALMCVLDKSIAQFSNQNASESPF